MPIQLVSRVRSRERGVHLRRQSIMWIGVLTLVTLAATPAGLSAQLTLAAAQLAARRASPALRATRDGASAAAARERQAGGYANPTLAYGREQTSRGIQRNAQNIAQVEQSIDVTGQRSARIAAARAKSAVAIGRIAVDETQIDFDVASALARAMAADQQARVAAQGADAFAQAQRVSDARVAAGDVSGYAGRRLRLEAARYAALRSEAMLRRRTARLELAALLDLGSRDADTLTLSADWPVDTSHNSRVSLDSLLARATHQRADLRVAQLEVEVMLAEARLTARERMPNPILAAGYKGERTADPARGSLTGFSGYVLGVAMPLPLFDRRTGARDAARSDVRRADAGVDLVRRRIALEVVEAYEALKASDEQRAALAQHIGEEARVALRAVHVLYAEGEISLVEWLDAVRAYQDAESTYITLQADVAIRRAALARAMGVRLSLSSNSER